MALSTTNSTEERIMDEQGGEINASHFMQEMQEAVARSCYFLARRIQNGRIRYNFWDGQSWSGRLDQELLDHEAFPYNNAMDNRIPLVDEIIQQDVRKILSAWLKGEFPQPVGVKDADKAAQLQLLVRNMTHSRMMPDIRREVENFSQYRQTFGVAALAVDWDEGLALENRTVTMDDVAQAAQQLGQDAQLIMAAMVDPEQMDVAIQFFQSWQIGVSTSAARKAIKDLQADGEATFVAPYATTGKVKWTAREVMLDILMPENTRDPQDARWLSDRHLWSNSELNDWAVRKEFREEWTEQVAQKKGQVIFQDWQTIAGVSPGGVMGLMDAPFMIAHNLVEVWAVYTKRTGDNGEVGVYYNYVHPAVEGAAWAEDKLLGYEHGMYPFVFGQREMISRIFLESRGWGECLFTQQNSLKSERDLQNSRSELVTCPPMTDDTERVAKSKFKMGPYARQPVKRGLKGPQFMQITGDAQLTMELSQAVRLEAYRYAGRYDKDIDPQISNEYTQDLVDGVMSELGQATFMTLQLMRQYMPREDAELLVGPLLINWPGDADEIRTPHAFTPVYDVRKNDHGFLKELTEVVNTVRGLDTTGRIDFSGIAGMLLSVYDPGFARFVRSDGQATQNEIKEQQARITNIAMGMQPPIPERSGVNPTLRLNTIKDALVTSTRLQKLFAKGTPEREVLDKDIQAYQFMLEQDNNAIQGRLGVSPAPMQGAPSPTPQGGN